MGCFLTMTRKDFAQISTSLKQYIEELPPDSSGGVRISVERSRHHSTQEMARLIRQQVPSARSIHVSAKDISRSIPTPERYDHIKQLLPPQGAAFYRALTLNTLAEVMGVINNQKGDVHEWVAGRILEESQGMRIVQWPDEKVGRQGVDLLAMGRGGQYIAVEVKTGDNIADLLEEGVYKEQSLDGRGCRQCSDEWFRLVGVDPEQVTVMAVCINPDRRTVRIFRRLDNEATRWKPIMCAPLSDFRDLQ